MEVTSFAEIKAEFDLRVQTAVYGNMATIDRQRRPRSRIIHPVWDGPIGWVVSWPESHKAKHLKANPFVSLAYIQDKDGPLYIDAAADWISDVQEKERIWNLLKATPPPVGFDPEPHYGTIHHRYFGLLRFTPWQIELAKLQGDSIIWRQTNMSEELK
jgi:hypothetical protein